jgi:hypothetical protein
MDGCEVLLFLSAAVGIAAGAAGIAYWWLEDETREDAFRAGVESGYERGQVAGWVKGYHAGRTEALEGNAEAQVRR